MGWDNLPWPLTSLSVCFSASILVATIFSADNFNENPGTFITKI